MPILSLTRIITVALLAVIMTGAAMAAFPDRSVHFIVPTTPGGGADTIARILATALSVRLGQPVVVENVPGANGMIGMGKVAHAEPDGYTLAITFTDHFINPSIYRSQPYDLLKDFTPVIYLGQLPFVLAVYPKVPATSVKALIELARRQPGALHFASAGTGGTLHMAGELFKIMTGVQMTHVPYKGASAALPDLISGNVELIFTSAISAKSYAEAGRIRLLATTGSHRAVGLPDLPTVAEAGVPGYIAGIWYGVVAPAKTPRAVVDLLNKEIMSVLVSQDFSEVMTKQGVELAPGTPEAFGLFYRSEINKWAQVVKAAKISPVD